MKIETIAIHAGNRNDESSKAVIQPIVLSTTFMRDADGSFPSGYIYSRSSNPNRTSLENVLAKLEEATQTGQFDERFRILCTNGEERWVKVHGFPVRDRSGKILRLVGTAQEVTAQKQAEDQVVKRYLI